MPLFRWLPGLSAIDLRRIDHETEKSDVLGAAGGFVLGTIPLIPLPILTTMVATLFGPVPAMLFRALYKLAVVYLIVLLAAHWTSIDNSA